MTRRWETRSHQDDQNPYEEQECHPTKENSLERGAESDCKEGQQTENACQRKVDGENKDSLGPDAGHAGTKPKAASIDGQIKCISDDDAWQEWFFL